MPQGFFGRPSAVDTVLAEMAERRERERAMKQQEELQRQRLAHEWDMSQRDTQSRYLAELIRSNPAHAHEIMASNQEAFEGITYDPSQFTPTQGEQFHGMVTQDAIQNFQSLPQSARQAGIYQMGYGAAMPKEMVDLIAADDVYSNKDDFAPETVGRQKVMDDLALSADETEKARQWGLTFEQIEKPKSQSEIRKNNAQVALFGAQTGLVGEQTTNETLKRDPASPVSPGFKANKPFDPTADPVLRREAEKRTMAFSAAEGSLEAVEKLINEVVTAARSGNAWAAAAAKKKLDAIIPQAAMAVGGAYGQTGHGMSDQDRQAFIAALTPGVGWSIADPSIPAGVLDATRSQLQTMKEAVATLGGADSGGKVLDEATAQSYLERAGGDPNRARAMARQDGYQF